jgi:peptidoglycan hydrolase-like protein with peptidoglycan-binding domain
MKKVIKLTESDLTKLVKRVITEQTEEREFIKGIQNFLNMKKITGDNKRPLVVDGKTDNNLMSQTAQAIAKYQKMIGASSTDGVWGEDTWSKMPGKDKNLLKNLIAKEGGMLDRFLNYIGL